jgi:hypothetical protein
VIYYSDTEDMGAYFPENILIISPRNKLIKVYSVCMVNK